MAVRDVLVECAWAASRKRDSYLAASSGASRGAFF
jgi:hypothetical protein